VEKLQSIRFAALLGVATCLAGLAGAEEPKPSPTPITWELQVNITEPARIDVDTGHGARTYWYVIYTVTNNNGQDVAFHPDIARVSEIDSEIPAEEAELRPEEAASLTTDPAMVGAHPKIYEAIRQRHARTHPFLVTPVKAIGTLLQGKDNARTGVAIFPELNPRVSRFTIYFGGLSGETVTRPNPLYDPRRASRAGKSSDTEDDIASQKVFVLQKTLAIPYTLPGDPGTRRTATPARGKMDWVMR
jgi:hypothetical protein